MLAKLKNLVGRMRSNSAPIKAAAVETLEQRRLLSASIGQLGLGEHRIYGVGDYTFTLKNATTINASLAKAQVAGKFKVRTLTRVGGERTTGGTVAMSTEKDVEVQFPSYASIVADADVISATNAAWASTLAATTPTSRSEEGFWIRLNTDTEKYEFTTTVLGPIVGPNQGGSVVLGSRPADSVSGTLTPLSSPTYTVASFHTHTHPQPIVRSVVQLDHRQRTTRLILQMTSLESYMITLVMRSEISTQVLR